MMATILIRQLDEQTKTRLRISAARHGRSMEEEARAILSGALRPERASQKDLAVSIRGRFARFGGVEIAEVKRQPLPAPPRLSR